MKKIKLKKEKQREQKKLQSPRLKVKGNQMILRKNLQDLDLEESTERNQKVEINTKEGAGVKTKRKEVTNHQEEILNTIERDLSQEKDIKEVEKIEKDQKIEIERDKEIETEKIDIKEDLLD